MHPTSAALVRSQATSTPACGQPVRGSAEQRAADEVGQERQRHDRGGQRRGAGLLVDQHGQRDGRHHAPEHRHDIRGEDRPELGGTQHVAVSGPGVRRVPVLGDPVLGDPVLDDPMLSRGRHGIHGGGRYRREPDIRYTPNNPGMAR